MATPKIKKVKLADLIPDNENVNNHSAYGMGLLENSIRFNGYGRSGVLSSDLKIIAGNGMTESAGAIGTEEAYIVESDGNLPIYVQRTDVKSGTPEFYNMALADNITALKNIVLDVEAIEVLAEEVPETKFWADIVTEQKTNRNLDEERADLVKVQLDFTSGQHSIFKKALKLAKQKFNIENPESDSEQSNLLVELLKEFIKQNK